MPPAPPTAFHRLSGPPMRRCAPGSPLPLTAISSLSTRMPGSAGAIPAGQRATDASLRARLAIALDRNKQLADENARLRRQLARALGDQRSSRTRTDNDPEE